MITHAAGESSPGNLPEGTYAIVLGVKDEAILRVVYEKLKAARIAPGSKLVHFSAITEDTGVYAGQLMSIGLRPLLRSEGRKLLSSYPLYRGPT